MSLGNERIRTIESKAEDVLLDTYGDYEQVVPPINLGRVLKKYNLKLQPGKFDDPSISGAYDKEAATIYVAEDEPLPRAAFTVAHELGHFILHQNKEEEVYYRQFALELDEEKKAEEQEANWFAASVLMPEKLVRRFWLTISNVHLIAQIFGVSSTAAYWRLKHLGLVN